MTQSTQAISTQVDHLADQMLALYQWERIVVGSVEELPGELRTEVRVSLPNVVSCCDYDLDGAYRLREVEELSRDEDPYSAHVGYVPLPRIRAFVEQAAQAERQSAANHA